MDQITLAKLKEGETFEGILWLVSGSVRKTRKGDPFWEGKLQDAGGSVSAKLWDSARGKSNRVQTCLPFLVPGRAVRVKAQVDAYQGTLQFNILNISSVKEGEVDPALFSPKGHRERATMEEEFDAIVDGMRDPDYKRLLKSFKADEDYFSRFASAPAAKGIHHAWIGGLLEHSLSLAGNVRAMAPNYPTLNEDLLLCGCFFHDSGKAMEISSDPGFEYTTDGKLFGHIYMGARLVERLCDAVENFPGEKKRHILHLVLSHQGERADGFGSPVDPATPEAVFFHQVDNLDAKVQNCLTFMERADEAGQEGDFTNPRDNFLRKAYYRRRPADAAKAEPPSAPPPEEPKNPVKDDSPQRALW